MLFIHDWGKKAQFRVLTPLLKKRGISVHKYRNWPFRPFFVQGSPGYLPSLFNENNEHGLRNINHLLLKQSFEYCYYQQLHLKLNLTLVNLVWGKETVFESPNSLLCGACVSAVPQTLLIRTSQRLSWMRHPVFGISTVSTLVSSR